MHGLASFHTRLLDLLPYVLCFQAHRDEVITMVANPVVDQVISAGLGEWKILCIHSLCFL